jgi:hypothetical protein
MKDEEVDLFFNLLIAPLEEAPVKVVAPVEVLEEAPVEVVTEAVLAVGHFIAEHDTQVSFFEKKNSGMADRFALEAVLTEPRHVLPGQRFRLCGRHILSVDHVIDPPHRWVELLIDNRIFVPWPDVLAADVFHHTAPSSVMVQPDTYIAGTILDYYVARYGQDSVEVL